MAGKYSLTNTSDGRFLFNLEAENGENILTSQSYEAKGSAQDGIESVRTNAPNDSQFDRNTSKDDSPYFVLKAGNGEVIGTSQQYSSPAAMETGIESVKANAPAAAVDDRTLLM
jgi:uncharacterized protein YegP (UPF0339 family)